MEVAAHEGGHLVCGEFDARVCGGVDWGGAVDPVEPGVDVESVVGDRVVDGGRDCCDLGEIADCQTSAAGATDDVVGWMLVGVGCLMAGGGNDLKDGVDADSLMRIDVYAFAVLLDLWEICSIDASREQECVIVVLRFIVCHFAGHLSEDE